MSITTKKGDQGQTDLFKKRVSKSDLRIGVVGCIDETMASILVPKHYIRIKEVHDDLNQIHQILSDLSYEIVLDDDASYMIKEEHVSFITDRKDHYQASLKPLTSFIKLDQTKAASFLNLARVSVRRLEREMVMLKESSHMNPYALMMINRLSDFLFVLARYFDEVK
jgi:cob(I)alamin adenosyltransferase